MLTYVSLLPKNEKWLNFTFIFCRNLSTRTLKYVFDGILLCLTLEALVLEIFPQIFQELVVSYNTHRYGLAKFCDKHLKKSCFGALLNRKTGARRRRSSNAAAHHHKTITNQSSWVAAPFRRLFIISSHGIIIIRHPEHPINYYSLADHGFTSD